jgi:hypothetical protein
VSPGRYGLQVGSADYLCCPPEEGDFFLTVEFERAPSLRVELKRLFQNLAPSSHKTRILKLRIAHAPDFSRAKIKCKPNDHCKHIKKGTRSLHGGLSLKKKEKFSLAPNTTIKIKVSKGQTYGRFWRITTHRADNPTVCSGGVEPSGALRECREE